MYDNYNPFPTLHDSVLDLYSSVDSKILLFSSGFLINIRFIWEFLSWLGGDKADWYSWGCRFNPWLHSLGWGSSIALSCGVGHGCGSDPVLLWLWYKPVAVAPIRPPARGLPCATGAALKSKKKPAKTKNKQTKDLTS